MNYFAAVYNINSFQDLIKYVDSFIYSKHFGAHFALDWVQVAHVAVLHDQKIPISIYFYIDVPSNVLYSFTMFGCSSEAIVLISWIKLFLSWGSLIIFFFDKHLIA